MELRLNLSLMSQLLQTAAPGEVLFGPDILASPTLSNTPIVGDVLTCSTGSWAGSAPITFEFQWFLGAAEIVGEVSNTYIPIGSDAGDSLSCRVTATNPNAVSFIFSNALVVQEAVVAPQAAGVITNQTWTEGVAISPLNVASDFTGTAPITYALAPSSAALPSGLSLSSEGVISGTPTTAAAAVNLIVRGTNSAGFADSGFSATVAATVPGQFVVGNWTLADEESGGTLTVDVTALPDDGGAAIDAIQYRIGAGAWTAFVTPLTGIGTRTITGLTDDVSVDITLRAGNSVGFAADPGSDTKAATPTPVVGAAFEIVNSAVPINLDAGGSFFSNDRTGDYEVTTGDGLIMILSAMDNGGTSSGSGIVFTVTYNGVAMTQFGQRLHSADRARLNAFYLPNPAVGLNALMVSMTGGALRSMVTTVVETNGYNVAGATILADGTANGGELKTIAGTTTGANSQLLGAVSLGHRSGNPTVAPTAQTPGVTRSTGITGSNDFGAHGYCVGTLLTETAGAATFDISWTGSSRYAWQTIEVPVAS